MEYWSCGNSGPNNPALHDSTTPVYGLNDLNGLNDWNEFSSVVPWLTRNI
jgi:hypothetical protein